MNIYTMLLRRTKTQRLKRIEPDSCSRGEAKTSSIQRPDARAVSSQRKKRRDRQSRIFSTRASSAPVANSLEGIVGLDLGSPRADPHSFSSTLDENLVAMSASPTCIQQSAAHSASVSDTCAEDTPKQKRRRWRSIAGFLGIKHPSGSVSALRESEQPNSHDFPKKPTPSNMKISNCTSRYENQTAHHSYRCPPDRPLPTPPKQLLPIASDNLQRKISWRKNTSRKSLKVVESELKKKLRTDPCVLVITPEVEEQKLEDTIGKEGKFEQEGKNKRSLNLEENFDKKLTAQEQKQEKRNTLEEQGVMTKADVEVPDSEEKMNPEEPELPYSEPASSPYAALVPSTTQNPLSGPLEDRGASPLDFTKDFLLRVEIPCIELERYSVMFSNLLQQVKPPSLLSRRQGHLTEIKLVTENTIKVS